MDFWLSLGFKSNPYIVKPLPGNEDGRELLVGRDAELRSLLRRMRESDMHVVLEGPNGVGKTSLVLVAAWVASEEFRSGDSQQLYLPLLEPLQVKEDSEEFVSACYFAIARAFLEYEDTLKRAGRSVPRIKDLRLWLDSPILRTRGGGITSPFGGLTGSASASANSSQGYTQAGFRAAVRRWLSDAFPDGSGGFVGLIDNLELIDISSAAQGVMEEVRDPVLQLPGTRWVICGARGIARSVAATPRLNGVLSDPIDISPVPDEFIPHLIDARLKRYAVRGDAVAPVSAKTFEHIYEVSHQNLRDSLSYAQDFSFSLDPEFFLQSNEARIENAAKEWLAELAMKYERDIRLQPRMWKLLDDLAGIGGSCSPGDHLVLGFNDRTHMRKNVVDLERYGLVTSSREETDQRRRSIEITSKGWLVHYSRSQGLINPTIPGVDPQ
ncbi:hypothetical protein [Streptomyces yaizuensis]|uniref:MarR family winged helix-turn-helix transcriptional regulator n=1 Tax=Streptomyces yaizuensis TaxID=2989713 RepID=A0ABQ5NVD8_9ACTN|nr:hypothetical protein [Streptomyces sp. YSPA8]GLF94307.1 MarR family winged helix-turn-helix transcriptional regulator [Streptomyces sp. YSPA8]